jgi:hypothetical protein
MVILPYELKKAVKMQGNGKAFKDSEGSPRMYETLTLEKNIMFKSMVLLIRKPSIK